MSNKSKNVLTTKSKIVCIVNDFDVNKEWVYCIEDITIGSNVWKIVITTNFMDDDYKEPMFVIDVNLKSKDNLYVRFESIIYESNMENRYRSSGLSFMDLSPDFLVQICDMTTQLFMAKKDQIFPKQRLVIGVIITVESKDVYQCIQRSIGYRNTFNVRQFNDFHIICGDKEFFVSKNILISYSEVFEKMFAIEMKEQNTNQLFIEDIDPKVFEEFLKFIYFGNSDKLEQLKEELLYVADRYQVLDLKEISENLMFIEICDSNAIKLLITFDKYNCSESLEKTIEFISKNLSEIKRKTPNQWKKLIIAHNQLLDRITERMSQLIKHGLIGDKTIDENVKTYTYSFIN